MNTSADARPAGEPALPADGSEVPASDAVLADGEFAPGPGVVYVNHAAAGLLPVRARNAMHAMLDAQSAGGILGILPVELHLEAFRRRIGAFIGGRPDEIAFLRNTSDGANVVARGLALDAGDVIVTNDDEFPANALPWVALRERGVEVRFVETARERMTPDVLRRHLCPRTRVVAVSWVAFADGYRHDLAGLAEVTHGAGALFAVDAIQGLGAFPLDVRKLGIDVLYAGGAKWLLAVPGVSLLYVAAEWQDWIISRNRGWRDVENIWNLFDYTQPPSPTAARYEGGTQNFLGILALDESIRLLAGTGTGRIGAHVLALTDRLVEGLERLGTTVVSPRGTGISSGIVTFRPRAADPVSLGRRLGARGIVTTYRASGVRLSPHGHNTASQIDDVLTAIAEEDRAGALT